MRKVVLDIETIPCDKSLWERLGARIPSLEKVAWEDTALDWSFGRVVCIGLLFPEEANDRELCLAGPDEAELLRTFWAAIRPEDYLIGHNVLGFDLPFLQARSVIHKVKPSRTLDLRRYSTATVYDTQQVWSNWGRKRFPKLDLLAAILELEAKSGSGDQVREWFEAGDWERIRQYCMQDVRLTCGVYRRMREYGL